MPLGAFKAALMGTAGVSTGDVVLLSSQTADGDSSLSFTSGITSTYGEYIFRFYDISAATNRTEFAFQVNASGESGYNETITSTMFRSYNDEGDSNPYLSYDTDNDQGQGTAYQSLSYMVSSAADEGLVGELHLFNPSSTTYVKHFTSITQKVYASGSGAGYSWQDFIAGYINTTAAITGVDFKMLSGNFDGKIKMWGVK
jgi:hypothetical protein